MKRVTVKRISAAMRAVTKPGTVAPQAEIGRSALLLAALLMGHPTFAATPAAAPASEATRHPYYGELHLHTTYSFDAYVMFGTRTTPDEAYKFARGETVNYFGTPVRRGEPLDFAAVTDHSENMGVFNQLDDPNSAFSKSEIGQKIHSEGGKAFWDIVKLFTSGKPLPGVDTKAISSTVWQKEIDAANGNYEPGKFTTFIAYEWSSMPEGKYNLHRNVIFRGDTAPTPFSSVDSRRPEDLWTYLEASRKAGYDVIAIPHNANASNGLMYGWNDSDGRAIDQVYAERRILNEPLSEISQNKGQSETHPLLSPTDEFANFELFDTLLVSREPSDPHGSYVRDAYGRGLLIEQRVGVNPYKFGVVGAGDFHNGLSTSAEDAYAGGAAGVDPNAPANPRAPTLDNERFNTYATGSGNLTGVWAEQNTRDSIYDALRRKETFATSGTRLQFRFFGGWNLSKAFAPNWVDAAYRGGVPMGGDLPDAPAAARAPRFAVWAIKDPNGANLDRVQIIKVWAANGEQHERVFDVAYAGDRKPDPKTGKLPAIGNTVDVKTATYTNSLGATELKSVWQDTQFDPNVPAAYYLRVIEIPTPRWSTIVAVKRGEAVPAGVPETVQERGWSSPIWYTPKGKSRT